MIFFLIITYSEPVNRPLSGRKNLHINLPVFFTLGWKQSLHKGAGVQADHRKPILSALRTLPVIPD